MPPMSALLPARQLMPALAALCLWAPAQAASDAKLELNSLGIQCATQVGGGGTGKCEAAFHVRLGGLPAGVRSTTIECSVTLGMFAAKTGQRLLRAYELREDLGVEEGSARGQVTLRQDLSHFIEPVLSPWVHWYQCQASWRAGT